MTNLDLSRSLLCLLLSMFAVRTGFAFQAKPGRPTDIFAPRQQMQRWHSTTAIGTATFPTPDGSGLGMERLSQEFSCPFMPLRRPLVVRPESAPERGLWLFEQVGASVPFTLVYFHPQADPVHCTEANDSSMLASRSASSSVQCAATQFSLCSTMPAQCR